MQTHRFVSTVFTITLLILASCSSTVPSVKTLQQHFHDDRALQQKLKVFSQRYPNTIDIKSIGLSYEQRPIYAVRLGASSEADDEKPALIALFTQHANEHEVTEIALGMMDTLLERSAKEPRVRDLLNRVTLWLVPMVNPDGVAYDLSGKAAPFSWRKNRRPTRNQAIGVDLNRNWARPANTELPAAVLADIKDPHSSRYAGPSPFSELELQHVLRFFQAQKNLTLFMDYHSGSGGFVQGFTGCFGARENPALTHCEAIIQPYAEILNDQHSKNPGYVVIESEQDIADALHNNAPWPLKPFLPKTLPPTPGKSLDYMGEQNQVMSIGLEINRPKQYFKNLAYFQARLVDRHTEGLLYLLEVLSEQTPP